MSDDEKGFIDLKIPVWIWRLLITIAIGYGITFVVKHHADQQDFNKQVTDSLRKHMWEIKRLQTEFQSINK